MGESRVIGSRGRSRGICRRTFSVQKPSARWGILSLWDRNRSESIGRPASGRTNIVVTTQNGFEARAGCLIAGSLDEALRFAGSAPGAEEVFVIGGEQIYKFCAAESQRHLSCKVHGAFDGDAFFPDVRRKSRGGRLLTILELFCHKKDTQNQF